MEGAYWQSLDRTVYSNGTILYAGTGVEEQAVLLYGTVGAGGAITALPHIQAEQTTAKRPSPKNKTHLYFEKLFTERWHLPQEKFW
jgi:hypothetical protein